MQSIFDNLINGKLQAAKKSAKRKSLDALYDFAESYLGWNHFVAMAAAKYLKNKITFQEYCDIEFKNK